MPRKKHTEIDFESAIAELESLVATMEEGDLPLEEALKQFERGVTLTRQCQQALEQAEQKVEILMEKAGAVEPERFDPDQ
ncbi:MAG: exodeoxyribonuclease VII small subunit [Gammaproteobacteria bacterium]|jgi:exodeoxyribonuclease VII small subunit